MAPGTGGSKGECGGLLSRNGSRFANDLGTVARLFRPRSGRLFGEDLVSITLAAIEEARLTIAGRVLRTPMLPAPPLSALTGANVYVKYENLQVTNSFKERGALTKLAALDKDERR